MLANKHILKAEKIVSGYDSKKVLSDVSLTIPCGKISVIIGSNACGKSTLLKTLARLITPSQGKIYLNNVDIQTIPTKNLAKTIGSLPQMPIDPEGISVSDLIGRGRFPHQKLMGGFSNDDYLAVADAINSMKIEDIANRNIDELSGGQKQRVWIAMALAQGTDILFLDEPTTFLYITYQIQILDLLTDINKKKW